MRYIFADCVLDTALATLHRAGRTIPLRPKVFHLLQYLLEQRAHLVTKDTLCAQIWPGQYISDTALEGCIKLARQAIGDSGRAQRLIQTRRGYGYRFVGMVEEQAVGHTEPRDTALAGSQEPLAVSSSEPTPGQEALASLGGEPGISLGDVEEAAARRYGAGAPGGERKLVTLLSCTLAHDPTLGDHLGLDALHSQMRALYAIARSEVQQYRGTLQPITGERFMALFGVPVAQEDHARRAVLAALGLLQQVAAQRATLAVRIGLHTALVAVWGLETRQRWRRLWLVTQ
jgi:DNA-binding winged helix-turn-helix (wHTH) protein